MSKPKIVVFVDHGRVDEVVSNTSLADVEILETDLEGDYSPEIQIGGETYTYYRRFPKPRVNKALVQKAFKVVRAARKTDPDNA